VTEGVATPRPEPTRSTRSSPPPGGPVATVIVLNWNGGERLLPDCLAALGKQDLDPERWQAWVVDNASTDDSLALLARDHPQVHVVRNATNLGFAGGNNVALRMARTPFVVLLNNDARPQADWLRRLLAAADAPGAERVAAFTSKLLFEPRFLALEIETPGYRTAADPRELGAMITRVDVDGRDVTEELLWDHVAYGPEGRGDRRFRWTRPAGPLLVPFPATTTALPAAARLTVTARAEAAKPLTVRWPGGSHTVELGSGARAHSIDIPAGVPLVDVVNNVGSILVAPGAGADRGYQEVDTGQYQAPEDVFLFCGAAACFRREALDQVGVFDDDFFMYYEDTDLAWRLQAAGWGVRYVPDAVVRHLHAASSVEWSPFFTFHVERNRLLTLAKNAPAGLAARQAARFVVTTGSMARWALLQAVRDQRRPALRPLAARGRVLASYLRLLPRALRERRRIDRRREVPAQALLDRWLQQTR
jgi:GT2 family glycosyltransferase